MDAPTRRNRPVVPSARWQKSSNFAGVQTVQAISAPPKKAPRRKEGLVALPDFTNLVEASAGFSGEPDSRSFRTPARHVKTALMSQSDAAPTPAETNPLMQAAQEYVHEDDHRPAAVLTQASSK